MMMNLSMIAMMVLFAAAVAPPAATAFQTMILPRHQHHQQQEYRPSSSSSSPSAALSMVSPETFFKAVECAENSHLSEIDIDKLDRLATELEEFEGECQIHLDDGSGSTGNTVVDLCDKEIQDRIDVAQILRLQIELHLRTDYLKKGNLFADVVRKEHDAEERKKFKAALLENRGKANSDLGGLW